jgi:predicted RNA-binding protein with PUA-like domain
VLIEMARMQAGERAFFYHSNEGKAVVGIVEVAKTHYPDPTDESGRFVVVDMRALGPMKTPVTLAAIRAEPRLAGMELVVNSRLSVQPVREDEWRLICEMGGVKP